MRGAALVCLVLLAAVSLVAAKDMSHELDEIEKIDSSVFNTNAGLVSSSPIEQAAAAVVSARDADLDADTEAVAALAAESGASAASDEGAMYSFRAMRHATELAGSSISVGEKASATHRAAMRILKGGKKVSADELFVEINREQQILAAKRALVARQKQSIADSEESLARLKRLIGDNRAILAKNEHALRRASDDLLQLIGKYQAKLKAGITREVGASADTPLGQPVRSRPHQRAAFTKWAPRGQRKVDTTKSKVALAAANAKGDGAKPAAAAGAAAAKPTAVGAAAPAAPAVKKMKFAEVDAEVHADVAAEDAVATAEAGEAALEDAAAEEAADEAAAEVAAEEHTEAEVEAEVDAEVQSQSEAEAEDESEDESEGESEAEAEEEEEEADEESEDESEDESEESEEEEESEDALLESGASIDLTVSREPVLAGLAAPPRLYDETSDEFVGF